MFPNTYYLICISKLRVITSYHCVLLPTSQFHIIIYWYDVRMTSRTYSLYVYIKYINTYYLYKIYRILRRYTGANQERELWDDNDLSLIIFLGAFTCCAAKTIAATENSTPARRRCRCSRAAIGGWRVKARTWPIIYIIIIIFGRVRDGFNFRLPKYSN
jgi:hypothetical protein